MHAGVLHTFGQAPVYEQYPDPEPGENEVLVQMGAAALNRIDRALASGSHYASPEKLPHVPGNDGIGRLEDGSRVWFAMPRDPYGTYAERTVVPSYMCAPVPEGLDDVTAAALVNPGMAAWMPLQWRGELKPDQTVLVLGATGVCGRLAVQIAKLLGAGRVVAAGRDVKALEEVAALGADATVDLRLTGDELAEAFAREAEGGGYQVVVDYVWGAPTEALLTALTQKRLGASDGETRLVQVGDGAGPSISLSAHALRSTALTISGFGGMAPFEVQAEVWGKLMNSAAEGKISIGTEAVPLADIEKAWNRGDRDGRRLVVVP
ncbi:zinc-binding alcohol dehydrogenase family protein [Streptomyces sp. NPDC021969]|uniref:quinone oxidoreductase family protein n=1 Tax=unclassified Streptomyces TaxID=2593676 RepID=UPI0033EEEB4E